MIINKTKSENHNKTPRTEFTPDVLPKAISHIEANGSNTGVSTDCTHTSTDAQYTPPPQIEKSKDMPHWYVLRTTYGREQKAYAYFVSHGVKAFCPSIKKEIIVYGKKHIATVSLLPNIFFAYGTEEHIKTFVYDNVNLPFLRFYYQHFHNGRSVKRTPMIVPLKEMKSFMLICQAKNEDIFVANEIIHKFEKGQLVKITKGKFAGVEGHVARIRGQQRVGIIIENMLTIATAYVPSDFLEIIDNNT